jgi:hypothetical protein
MINPRNNPYFTLGTPCVAVMRCITHQVCPKKKPSG